MYSKNNYVVHIRALKQALNHGLILKKAHRVIQFNQKAWLKPRFPQTNENAVLGKTKENARKHRDIKLVTTDKRRNRLISEPNYHTPKYFSKDLLAIEMKKNKSKNE